MRAKVELSEPEIRAAIASYVADRTGVTIQEGEIVIEVKSKQNYRSEWEKAAIRCEFDAGIKQ